MSITIIPNLIAQTKESVQKQRDLIAKRVIDIGICGYGFVGKALHNGFKHFGITNFTIYDPFKSATKVSELSKCKMVFVCVPTPMGKDGSMDVTAMDTVLGELDAISYNNIVVIKSTVTPLHIKELSEKYNKLKIIANPEFLTERSADQDFINSKWVIIGGKEEYTADLADLSKRCWPAATVTVVSLEAAMMMKYMTNSWFAVKVSLLNEFFKLYQSLGCTDWDELMKAFATDVRVGPSHLAVPGPDGDFGWGGKCFPKDLNAMMALAQKFGTLSNVMQAAWATNKKVRTNKDWLTIDGAVSKDYAE